MVSIIRKILNFISRPFLICFDIKNNNVKMSISENKMENIVIINDDCNSTGNSTGESPTTFFKGAEVEKEATPPSYTKKRPEKISFCSASEDLLDLDSPFITKQDLKMKNRAQLIFRPNTIHDDSDSIEMERNVKIKKS